MELDHAAVLRKVTGLDTPKIVRLVIGNPLVMKKMAKHVPDAGSYAPVTVLVDEEGKKNGGLISPPFYVNKYVNKYDVTLHV